MLFRYGTCDSYKVGGTVIMIGQGSARLAPVPTYPNPIPTLLLKAMMTSPSVDRLLLMACVSRRRSRSPGPRAKPGSSRSLPARSTKLRGAPHCRPRPACSPEICSWNTLWLRDDRSFWAVRATARFRRARWSRAFTYGGGIARGIGRQEVSTEQCQEWQ